ncbi:glycoside hydrolase family 26 protein [Streptomyces sp. NBC_00083]|uniref:glycoside hydrolase family 26 protein n=1 Tax=Streptomyces sp. NBC_00083 TaxID=2975647 RepID=UPI002250D88E|nr:glycosyl hydrolase [Streptomyces sp. NBC_00083]MCX5381761.1 glycosyl hydrolase [Streptomyces sp. NBC_00083]
MRRRRHRAATFTTSVLVAGALFSLALAPGPDATHPAGGAEPVHPSGGSGVTRPVPAPGATPPAGGAQATPPAGGPQATRPGSGADPPGGHPVANFGAFLDSGLLGVKRIPALEKWLGGADIKVGHTYLPGNTWSDIEGRAGFLDDWASWRRARADRTLVLNVPMQALNEAGIPDSRVRQLLAKGAAGEFDEHFTRLAERLVELKIPETVIVLGWEMNGTTYTHRCGPDPAAWKTYWKRAVAAMRAVPGQKFRFDFTPSRGRDAVPWTECYPGDDVVDIIGMDSYDQPRGMDFDKQVKEPYGLQQHVDFAAAHHKPVSYPEWGLFHNGDNPEYMRRMLAWMDVHKPVYNTITDYCPHGVWGCADNPQSSEVYRALLFGRTDATPQPSAPVSPLPSAPVSPLPSAPVSPLPSTPASPQPAAPAPVAQTPKPPEKCAPVDLGSWVEYWIGGKLCLRFDWFSRRS